MELNWESELAQLLSRLGNAQNKLFELLGRKRELLVKRDHASLSALLPEEQQLCAELQACHDQRQQLLELAGANGLPADSILALAGSFPRHESQSLYESLDETNRRSRLLRHHCVAQWVAVQRTMLHLSHMIEIIATGGQLKPTYGKGGAATSSGALMDQAV